MTAPAVDFAVVLCECGHTRAGHRFGYARGSMRYLACGQCKRGHCDEFEEQEVPDAPADVPAVVEPAPPVEPAPAGLPTVPVVDLAIADDSPLPIEDGAQRCRCGHIRAVHATELLDDGDQVAARRGRCRQCGHANCPAFGLLDVDAELEAIAAAAGMSIEAVRAEWAAMQPTPRRKPATRPAIEAPAEPGGLNGLAAEVVQAVEAGRLDVHLPPVESSWDAWLCAPSGRRYRERFDVHGAPAPCRCQLVPVTVTVTRRAA